MANALTTLMQCGAFLAYKRTLPISSNLSALFFNDDGTIGCEDATDLETYKDGEDLFLAGLGLIPKGSKTWQGQVAILCETYEPPDLGRKRSYVEYARRIPFSASCILDAKALSNLTLDPYYGEPRWDLFTTLVEFFGTESGQLEEVTAPAKLGGWVNFIYGAVDLSFLDMSEVTQFSARGCNVGYPSLKPLKHSKDLGVYITPLERYTKSVPLLPKEIQNFYDIGKTNAEMSAKFSKNKRYHSMVNHLRKELEKRFNMFRVPTRPLSFKELFDELYKRDPTKDILPPRHYIKIKPRESISIEGEGRFETASPFKSVCAFFSPKIEDWNVVPWPFPPETGGKGPSERKLRDNMDRNYHFPHRPEVMLPGACVSDRVLARRDWVDSYNVWSVWSAITGTPDYPVSPFLSPIAELHRKFQEYEFTVESRWHIFKYAEKFGYQKIRILGFINGAVDYFLSLEPPPEEKIEEPDPHEGVRIPKFNEWYFNRNAEVPDAFLNLYWEGAMLLETSMSMRTLFGQFGKDDMLQNMAPNLKEGRLPFIAQLCGLIIRPLSRFLIADWPETNILDNSDDEGFGDIFGD